MRTRDALRTLLAAGAGMFVVTACETEGVQTADTRADVTVSTPAFAQGAGPQVYIDGGHNNFHTAEGRYRPFAELLTNDGLRVSSGSRAFTDESLQQVDVLVIANADYRDEGPALLSDEIEAVARFVERGGSLLLIADHVPYAGAAAPLGARFGIRLEDVFAEDDDSGLFTLEDGGLVRDPVLGEVGAVRTFAGSAFTIDHPAARPLMRMGPGWTMQTMAATGLSEKVSAEGRLQGALLEHGAGRVAVFGEAAMFTAQVEGGGPMARRIGFNARGAEQNKQFILNVMRWLAHAP